MISKQFLDIYTRDLNKLKEEIILYKKEEDLWALQGDVKNPAGTLVLHLVGNLKHFIGAVLGDTGFVRDRDLEFSKRNIPASMLLEEIDETIAVVNNVLSNLSDEQAIAEYPAENFGKGRTTIYALAQLTAHLNYHLGQVNYHRRMT